jgi:TRAP-type C4-dicarboxylate transport system permease small subunit
MGRLDRCLASILGIASVLVLPVSLLLFLQWPLREIAQRGAREANDLAQILFALFVSAAVTAATRDRAHLATDFFARRYSAAWKRRLWRAACLAILIPAACFVIWSGGHAAWMSLVQLERFPETFNPGYFVVRLAVIVLALLVLLQALVDLFAPGVRSRG